MPAVLGDRIGARGAGCWLAKAKPVDTVVAGRAVGRSLHLLGGLEVLGACPARNAQERSGCVGKIEARLSPNCLDMASPPAANWHPTAHVSGSRASFGPPQGPDRSSLPLCT